jgi:hypothetical protein
MIFPYSAFPGTNVMVLKKIFKKFGENLAFFVQYMPVYAKIRTKHCFLSFFRKKRQYLAQNWLKSPPKMIVALTPDQKNLAP